MKRCSICRIKKKLEEFSFEKNGLNGRRADCKKCKHEKDRIYRLNNYDIESRRKRNWSILNRQKRNKTKLLWKNKNRHKTHAVMMVDTALRQGKIKRLPCEKCGNKKSQGHHENYSKPLEVVWLCQRHHAERHQFLNQSKR